MSLEGPSETRPDARDNNAAWSEPLELMEALKEELRTAIGASEYTDRDVARRLGRSNSYLPNLFIKNPRRPPAGLRVDTWFALAQILDLDPRPLLERAWTRVHPRVANDRSSRARILAAGAVSILHQLEDLLLAQTEPTMAAYVRHLRVSLDHARATVHTAARAVQDTEQHVAPETERSLS